MHFQNQCLNVKQNVLVLIFILSAIVIHAQKVDRTSFRGGVNTGIVMGDFSEAFSFVLGVDITQHWGVSKALDIGIATGFSNAFGEKQTVSAEGVTLATDFDNFQIIPVGASIRLYPARGFKIGGDAGYAIGINEGNNGAAYYRPMLGVDIARGATELNVSYMSVLGDIPFAAALVSILVLF